MTCEEAREELEAYSLGALEPAEARRVAAHVRTCDDCAQIVRAYEMAVQHISLAVPLFRASPRLKERILGGIGAFRPPIYAGLMRSRWLAGAAASIILALAIGGIAWAIVLSSEVHSLRQDNSRQAELLQLDKSQRDALLAFQSSLSSQQNQTTRTLEEQAILLMVALDPDLVPTELTGTQMAQYATCSYVWSGAQGLGALTCKDLPQTASSSTYELWATRGEQSIALGAFAPRIDGTAQLLVKFPSEPQGPVTNLWVTLESTSTARTKPSNTVVLHRSPEQQAAR